MDLFNQPEITQSSNCFCNPQSQQNTNTHKIQDISPYDGFLDFDWPTQNKQLNINEFNDLEDFNFGFNLPHLHESFDFDVDQKPLNLEGVAESGLVETTSKIGNGFVSFVKKEENQELPLTLANGSIRSKKSTLLQFDEIKKHFDVPITMTAKKLNVGVTLLKRRCRQLKITRWPHRKLKSLMLLINNLKELGLVNEVAMLEKYKKMIEKIPGMELNEEIKKLRQAYFKSTYKKRRLITLQP